MCVGVAYVLGMRVQLQMAGDEKKTIMKVFKPEEIIHLDVGGTVGMSIKCQTLTSIDGSKLKQYFKDA